MSENETERGAQFVGGDGNEVALHAVKLGHLVQGVLHLVHLAGVLDGNRCLRGSPGSSTGRGSPGSSTGRGSPGSRTGHGARQVFLGF